jgi:hypothetical protein
VIFRVAGAAAAELAKRLDVVERNGRLADNLVVGVDRPPLTPVRCSIE